MNNPGFGRYMARRADGPSDMAAVLALRARCFRGGLGTDEDAFDALCQHVMIEDSLDQSVLCTFRLLELSTGAEIARSYSAQYYDLAALRAFDGPMLEMGRFCISPGSRSPDILRLAWGAMSAQVDRRGVGMLFGCSSFRGTEGDDYRDAFALLRQQHLAPRRWRPRIKSPDVFRFASGPQRRPDPVRALRAMPPLLRSYLAMGGWVSDHAVVDRDLATLHVFTGLEVGSVPPARRRLLRAVAADQPPLATDHALA